MYIYIAQICKLLCIPSMKSLKSREARVKQHQGLGSMRILQKDTHTVLSRTEIVTLLHNCYTSKRIGNASWDISVASSSWIATLSFEASMKNTWRVNEFEWIAGLPPSLLKHLETHNCPGQETPPKRIKKDKSILQSVEAAGRWSVPRQQR